MSDIQQLAENLPDYQSSRGNEFRDIPIEEREGLATVLRIARVQAENEEWDSNRFRQAMRSKKEDYMYQCGRLGINLSEVQAIWWNVVYENIDSSPARRNSVGLI